MRKVKVTDCGLCPFQNPARSKDGWEPYCRFLEKMTSYSGIDNKCPLIKEPICVELADD